LYTGSGGRTEDQGYEVELNPEDSTRQKFTGKERDNETGLDYFEARYFSSAQGRFTSADPLYFQVMMAIDPQRFNLYSYARNNPLKFIDPSGEKLYLRGNIGWLRTNVLYEMAGGQENFDKYFDIIDGQVVARSGVDISGANSGVQELFGLVSASENYVYFAGTDGTAAADLFQGSREEKGKPSSLGKGRAKAFEGKNEQRAGGTLVGTTGREINQPANLANGDPVFAVIAYNTNMVQTQEDISFNYMDFPSYEPIEMSAQMEGKGQRIQPVSLFIHESAENLEFSRIGANNANYKPAHEHALRREGVIRRELHITGGFAGGSVRSRVPKQ
jgi:RHS repeat-associated protein